MCQISVILRSKTGSGIIWLLYDTVNVKDKYKSQHKPWSEDLSLAITGLSSDANFITIDRTSCALFHRNIILIGDNEISLGILSLQFSNRYHTYKMINNIVWCVYYTSWNLQKRTFTYFSIVIFNKLTRPTLFFWRRP